MTLGLYSSPVLKINYFFLLPSSIAQKISTGPNGILTEVLKYCICENFFYPYHKERDREEPRYLKNMAVILAFSHQRSIIAR